MLYRLFPSRLISINKCIRKYSGKVNALVNKVLEPIVDNNQFVILEDIITPLARTPYERQLRIKLQLILDILTDFYFSIEKKTSSRKYKIFPFSPSPVLEHYRNKDEFSVQRGFDGDEKTFGLFCGKSSEGKVYAVRPTHLINIKPEHKRVLQVFENFVKKSPLPPCYRLDDGGYWRQLLLRSNLKGDIMAIVIVHPQNYLKEKIETEKKQLVQHFLENNVYLHSLYHQQCKNVQCTKETSDLSLIYGEAYLYEDLLGRKFRISPDSFFYINVEATKVLCEEVMKIAEFNQSVTLLDICCGVGIFSILYSNLVRNCIGIEQKSSCFEDALINLSLNNIHNCEFSFGQVETRLKSVYNVLENVNNVTVIVNSGRSGLHPRTIKLLRQFPAINKILYISANLQHKNTQRNFQDLLKNDSKKTGQAFKLRTVKGVDLFPHTFHYQVILKFER